MGLRGARESLQLCDDPTNPPKKRGFKMLLRNNSQMDFARILKRITSFEDTLRILEHKVTEIRTLQKRNHEKVMEGFRCIEKAFKLNCSAQMTMSEQLDEATGLITDFD